MNITQQLIKKLEEKYEIVNTKEAILETALPVIERFGISGKQINLRVIRAIEEAIKPYSIYYTRELNLGWVKVGIWGTGETKIPYEERESFLLRLPIKSAESSLWRPVEPEEASTYFGLYHTFKGRSVALHGQGISLLTEIGNAKAMIEEYTALAKQKAALEEKWSPSYISQEFIKQI